MNIYRKRILLVLIVLLSLPILLHVYQPGIVLGAFGLMVGAIGFLLSPIILFAVLLVFVIQAWKE